MKVPLSVLGWVVGRTVSLTFGGGLPAMELLRRTGTARGWLDAAGHALLVAVSRLTPGTNILAYCVALGWQLRGWPGAATALLAASVPTSLLVLALVATLVRIDGHVVVRALLAVGMLVATGLVLLTAWQLLRPHVTPGRRVRSAVIAAIAAALLLAGATPVRILLAAAVVAAIIPGRRA